MRAETRLADGAASLVPSRQGGGWTMTLDGGDSGELAGPVSTRGPDSGGYDRLAPRWFIAIYAASVVGCVYTLAPFIGDLVLAAVLLAMFQPTYTWLVARWRRPWACSALVVLLIVLVVAVPLGFLTVTIASEATTAYEASKDLDFGGADGILARVRSAASEYGIEISPGTLAGYVGDGADAVKSFVLVQLRELLNNTLSALLHFTVVLVAVFYLLVDGPRLKALVFELSPLPIDQEQLLVDTFGRVSRGILLGNGIASVAQGVLAGIAMAVAGLPSPVLWATVMSLFAFLPLVGISVVVIPATGYLFFTGSYAAALGFFAFCTAQGLVIENVVKTKLISQGTRMHDLVVLLSVLGGIAMFGILGLLYGPLLVTLFTTLTDLYRTHYRTRFSRRSSRPAPTA